MKAFSRLYQTLDQTTSTNAKVAAMVDYFKHAPVADAAWAVYFLSGRRLKRLIGAAKLREWLAECSDLPAWLVEDCYASVGDLAETIALLIASAAEETTQITLAEQVQALQALATLDEAAQKANIISAWQTQGYAACFITNKLLTGGLRVGVSQLLLARAVALYADLPRAVILHRLMGDWTPDEAFWHALISEDDGSADISRPYPFCLASPLEAEPATLGDINDWVAEWKWDGIRSQLIRRNRQTFLWSRGEELITTRFPDITEAAEALPDGTVLDGEVLPWKDDSVLPFNELQRRIGRKTVGKKLLTEVPCVFLAYDCMEAGGSDIRSLTLAARRKTLEHLVSALQRPAGSDQCRIKISTTIEADSWQALATRREESRRRLVEGLMLKHRHAPFHAGRKRGDYWKWKIDPYTVDAVMLYAQAGHGKRSNLYTDYTFGVWDGETLVPIAKAYSGLDNHEINQLDKWIRKNTVERFGPVRSVTPAQVFELAFEGINTSSRHKSGIAVRFPRIARWRHDLSPNDADTLTNVKKMISHE
jgi:DNA ligase-1